MCARRPAGTIQHMLIDVPADDAYAVVDVHVPAGTAMRPHASAREDTILLVIDGDLDLVVGDDQHTLAAGDQVVLPRDVPRRLAAVTDAWVLSLAV
jgi:quercetin dioxygenase-like cupin family protein